MTSEDVIEIVEEPVANSNGQEWTETFTAAGQEVFDMVMKLVHEANVRRIVIKNEERNIHWQVPMLVGVAGIALWPLYAALGLIVALAADFKIEVTRAEKAPEDVEPDVAE